MNKLNILLVLVVIGLLFVGGCASTGEATAPTYYSGGGGCGRLASDSTDCNAVSSNAPAANSAHLK